jgi:uncharacterized protein YrzB (UPF0473 family)
MTDHTHDHKNCNDPNHHHEHDHEHDENIFILTDENGVDHEMIMIYTFETNEKAYAVLIDRNEPESDAMILRIEEEQDEAYLEPIEDEQEWNHVVKVYEEIVVQEET